MSDQASRTKEEQKYERDHNDNQPTSESQTKTILAMGWRIGLEMVVSVVVCVMIGKLIDSWFDTSPWALIVMFFLGAAAGIRNVYRNANTLFRAEE